MRSYYVFLLPLSLLLLVGGYWFSGPLMAGYGAGLFVLGFVSHKHRAYARSLKARAVGEYESALDRWFGA